MKEEQVTLEYTAAEENITDFFTKPVSKSKLQKFKATMLGIWVKNVLRIPQKCGRAIKIRIRFTPTNINDRTHIRSIVCIV